MAQAAKAQEPSMEEILASIRRIIADDDGAKAKAPEPAPPPKAEPAPPPKAAPAPPPPKPAPVAAPADDSAGMGQDEIDAMLAAAESATEDEAPADVLDLTEAMEAPPPPPSAPSFRKIEPKVDIDFAEADPVPPPSAPKAPPPSPPRMTQEAEPGPALLSPRTTAVVDAAFNSLAHTVLVQNATTLEDLVKEMLRPLLKTWLDDNLPILVERLVRAEIERVSRGRG